MKRHAIARVLVVIVALLKSLVGEGLDTTEEGKALNRRVELVKQ